MPTITANNISIYYEQHGAGDDLVLIGGLTADHQVWKSALRILSKHFRVLIFDNRGAGQTDAPDVPYTTVMMAHDTLALMAALNISRAHIVGHSLGGCIAQQITLLSPEKINKMVIACSRAKPNTLATMVLSMREKLQSLGIKDDVLAEYVMPFLFSETFLSEASQIKGFIQWTLNNTHPQTAIGYKRQLQAVLNHNVEAQLPKITIPTLVIAGSEDCLMPTKVGKAIADKIPHSVFKIITDCAHMPHVEKAREFSEHIVEFIKS